MPAIADRRVWHLARAFTARFFENEITEGTDDLKASFFWLIAFLAPIGFLMPWFMSVGYQVVFIHWGAEGLREVSRGDKVLYLGLSMLAAGALSVVSWNALLADRRDAHVLGVLPVSSGTIVRAKLAALAAYIGLVAVGMHAAASLSFGVVLSNGENGWFALRGVIAHFIAAGLASAFTFLSIAAVQGLLLAVAGPRRFSRLSSALQLAVSAAILGAFLALPAIGQWASGVTAAGDGGHSWALWTPPVWFLGLYESIIGTPNPLWHWLAWTALSSVAVLAVMTAVVHPIAYRRVIEGAVEMAEAGSPRGWARTATATFERLLAVAPRKRAALQFIVATCSRVQRQRLALAVCAGVMLALLLPASVQLVHDPDGSSPGPSAEVLSAPMIVMLFSLVGLRLAAALPADVKASWVFALIDDGGRAGRSGLWRTMFAAGVLPVTLLSFGVLWSLWDASYALTQGLLGLAVGCLLIETLLWNYSGMPCARRWNPGAANLRTWWPAYLAGFLLVTQGSPQITLAVRGSGIGFTAAVVPIVALAVVMNLRARRTPAVVLEDGGD